MPEPFLTPEERFSPLWIRLRAHMSAELDTLRVTNDAMTLDAIQTARLRGRIFQLKSLLALGDEPKPQQDFGGPD